MAMMHKSNFQCRDGIIRIGHGRYIYTHTSTTFKVGNIDVQNLIGPKQIKNRILKNKNEFLKANS